MIFFRNQVMRTVTEARQTARVAVIGATGAVGRQMLLDLATAGFKHVTAFASPRSAGQQLPFGTRQLSVRKFARPSCCKGFDAVLLSVGGDFSRRYGKQLAAGNTILIDNSSAFRMDADVPLVVPEVNAALLDDGAYRIVANPNCSTIQLVVVLAALQRKFGLQAVDVATYQAVSGAGQRAVAELEQQLQDPQAVPRVFAQPIAGNVLAAIDRFDAAGHCFEEVKMVCETRRILDLPRLRVHATTVRVPVYYGHSEAVTVALEQEVTRAEALACLQGQEGLELVSEDDHARLPTPRTVAASSKVWVTRVRLPYGEERSRWVQFFVIANNLKKGAATNAVQILTKILEGNRCAK